MCELEVLRENAKYAIEKYGSWAGTDEEAVMRVNDLLSEAEALVQTYGNKITRHN